MDLQTIAGNIRGFVKLPKHSRVQVFLESEKKKQVQVRVYSDVSLDEENFFERFKCNPERFFPAHNLIGKKEQKNSIKKVDGKIIRRPPTKKYRYTISLKIIE